MINTPRRLAAAYLASLCVVVLTACSSASGPNHAAPRSAHASFLNEVNKVCARAVAAHSGHDFPLPGFDPEHPKPDQLPIVGDYFARYGRLPQTTAALDKLTPPMSERAAWHHLLAIADHMQANAERQITAARIKDAATFVTTVHIGSRLTDELNAAGGSFGFTPTSARGKVFG